MATRANVGYQHKTTGKYHVIYNHYDGYPSGLGKALLFNCNSYAEIVELVADGDMRYPGDHFKHDANERGECDARIETHLMHVMDEEYAYVWIDDTLFWTEDGDNYKPLCPEDCNV